MGLQSPFGRGRATLSMVCVAGPDFLRVPASTLTQHDVGVVHACASSAQVRCVGAVRDREKAPSGRASAVPRARRSNNGDVAEA